MNNVPCHIELNSIDLDKTSKFYNQLFGWSIIDSGIPNYRLIKFALDFPMAGAILQTSEKALNEKQWPIIYIMVSSIEETIKKAQELGASLVSDVKTIRDRGKWAIFCDKDGNHIALWEVLKN